MTKEVTVLFDTEEINPVFYAYRNGKRSGHLEVSQQDHGWIIESIGAMPYRRGIGSTLLREFVAWAGDGQLVSGVVSHEPTRRVILEEKIYPITDEARVEVVDPEKLNLLPLVRVRTSGGIETTKLVFERMSVSKNRSESPLARWHFFLEGITHTNPEYQPKATMLKHPIELPNVEDPNAFESWLKANVKNHMPRLDKSSLADHHKLAITYQELRDLADTARKSGDKDLIIIIRGLAESLAGYEIP